MAWKVANELTKRERKTGGGGPKCIPEDETRDLKGEDEEDEEEVGCGRLNEEKVSRGQTFLKASTFFCLKEKS